MLQWSFLLSSNEFCEPQFLLKASLHWGNVLLCLLPLVQELFERISPHILRSNVQSNCLVVLTSHPYWSALPVICLWCLLRPHGHLWWNNMRALKRLVACPHDPQDRIRHRWQSVCTKFYSHWSDSICRKCKTDWKFPDTPLEQRERMDVGSCKTIDCKQEVFEYTVDAFTLSWTDWSSCVHPMRTRSLLLLLLL